MCCLHDTPRTFDWCEENCERYYSCDTVAWAGDDAKIRESTNSERLFTVNLTETTHGFAEVEADSEDEARAKAEEAYENGNVVWANSEFTITNIK